MMNMVFLKWENLQGALGGSSCMVCQSHIALCVIGSCLGEGFLCESLNVSMFLYYVVIECGLVTRTK